jgi:lipopolysaccharide transport system ATP-binding protein
MSSAVITVENLSKRYLIGRQRSKDDGIRQLVENAVRSPLKWLSSRPTEKQSKEEEFWALRGISFEVKQGEVLGIIGRNGAGKSTLLKILSRITEPTTGRIGIDGRVASLLEVGTGFHPELTGRENVFLNGAILGMSRVEIKRKFDEIVDFSEIEKFIDTPVKRYSSGMYVRLAFAVAAHLEPEILIVDEVLAVGDANFQQKCLGKMESVGKSGRTIIFVSHNVNAVAALCNKALVFRQGSLIYAGDVQTALGHYGSSAAVSDYVTFAARPEDKREPFIRSLRIIGGMNGLLTAESDLCVEIEVDPRIPLPRPRLGLALNNPRRERVMAVATWLGSSAAPAIHKRSLVRFRFKLPLLVPGRYTIDLGLYDSSVGHVEEHLADAAIEIAETNYLNMVEPVAKDIGMILVKSEFEVITDPPAIFQ